MIKKISAALIALTMSVCMFTSCGKSSSSDADSSSSSSSSTADSSSSGDASSSEESSSKSDSSSQVEGSLTIDGKKQEDDELRDTLKEIFIGDDENGTSVTTDGEDSTESSGKSETSEKDG